VQAGYTCSACSMNFSIDPTGERASRGAVVCPRCAGPAERRAVQIGGASPQLVVTPSGLVMTEVCVCVVHISFEFACLRACA